MRESLPRWAVRLVSLCVADEAREPFLGDLSEEFQARGGGVGRAARLWLAREVTAACVSWTAYRAPRSERLRSALAPWVGAGVAWVVLMALNMPSVLGLVRSLPATTALPVAHGLNLMAIVIGGLAVAVIGTRRPLGAGLLFAMVAVVVPVSVTAVLAGRPPLPLPAWTLVTAGVGVAVPWVAHRLGSGSPRALPLRPTHLRG